MIKRAPQSGIGRFVVSAIAIALDVLLLPFFVIVAALSSCIRRDRLQPRIVWGSTPLINNVYWSRAMRKAGFQSETYMYNFYSIGKRDDFDRVLIEEYRWCPLVLRPYLAFLSALMGYDIVVTSFSGFMLVTPLLRRLQAELLKMAAIKTIVIPYGGDAYVYRNIRSIGLVQGLLYSYPQAARKQKQIQRDIDYWCKHADVIIASGMAPDGIGRWDVPMPSSLFIDLDEWKPTRRQSTANGIDNTVVIGHAPNHRGFKGSEFVIAAVEQLLGEGLQVQLKLLEGVSNMEVRSALASDIDVLVEQLIHPGHGMNGLEGMASGIPVICNLEDEDHHLVVRRWSYFSECPLVSADPENIVDVLRELVTKPELRTELGNLGRQYVEKYHGLDSSSYLFTAVIDYLYGRRASLMDLYHPLTSDYVKRLPFIVPPLEKNRLKLS